MDTWQAAQSWILFIGGAGGLAAYYYYSQHGSPTTGNPRLDRRRVEQEARERKQSIDSGVKSTSKKSSDGKESAKKRKAPRQEPTATQPTPQIVVQQDERVEKEDVSNKQFAEQMSKARKGADLSAPKNKENRVKTVKQGSAMDTPVISSGSSHAGADADDDLSPAASPALGAGDVSDMLEPAAKGPSTLRLTAPAQPQKQRVQKQSKDEDIETKKQRQNRAKKEQQRLEREAEEKGRKALEEKQRRAAREARGEPARNGIPAKAPASSAWTAPKPAQDASTNGTNGPLLDTFDAESTASSNGGPEPSTAATSTTEAEAADRDNGRLSEEEQMAMAVKQSENESGWTTAAPKKKQPKKKPAMDGDASGAATPVEPVAATKPTPAVGKSATKPAMSAKPNGFSSLNDEVDANDASNWDP